MRGFALGVVAAIVFAALAGVAGIWFGLLPAGADVKPSGFERWAARRSLNATMRREMPATAYPDGPPTDASIVAGAKLYQVNCAVCHGSGSGDASNIAKGMYIKPPQFAQHGVDDDPAAETYWKIEHGIRFSGMPAFAGQLTEQQIWQVTAFLGKSPDALPPAAKAVWNEPHGD